MTLAIRGKQFGDDSDLVDAARAKLSVVQGSLASGTMPSLVEGCYDGVAWSLVTEIPMAFSGLYLIFLSLRLEKGSGRACTFALPPVINCRTGLPDCSVIKLQAAFRLDRGYNWRDQGPFLLP